MIDYPAISVGPRDRGRSYGVLNHSLAAGDFARIRPMLEDFSLALAAWADLGRQRFVALSPVDAERSAWVLWRARFIGTGDLGTVAVANGLVVTAVRMERLEERAHRLLAFLAEPDGGPFGADAVAVPEPAPAPAVAPIKAFGLEWRDQVVDILDGADPEAVLIAALEGISPSVQIARIDGWADTGTLQASGAFDPADAFRLIVRPQGEPRGGALADRTLVQIRAGQIVTPPQATPPVWRAWQAAERASVAVASSIPASWKPGWLALAADRVATLALLQNAAHLAIEDRLALVACALREAADDDLAAPMGVAVGQALLRLAANADRPADAVRYLEAGLVEARFGVRVAQEIARSAPLDRTLAALVKPALESALEHGVLERLAGPEGSESLSVFGPEVLMTMLGRSLQGAAGKASMRSLAVALIARLSDGEALSRRYAAAGVSALIEMPVHARDVGLALPAVAGLVREFPRIDRPGYAAHALRPVLRGEVRLARPAFVEALRATARLLEPAA